MNVEPKHSKPGTVFEIAEGVRHATSGSVCLVFNAKSGSYFTLRGEAAKAWTQLASGTLSTGNLTNYITEFLSMGLLADRASRLSSTVAEGSIPGISRHSEFDHLILGDSTIDIPLLGEAHHAPLAHSNRRDLLDRIRVRRFITSVLQDAHRYVAEQEMLQFHLAIGDVIVRVQVPAVDRLSEIPLSSAFLPMDMSPELTADYCITFIDDSSRGLRRSSDFEMDWHLPLGLLNEELTGDSRVAVDRHTQTVSVFAPSSRQCVVWTRNYASLPYWFTATPLRLQLSWIADRHSLEFLHAAAVKIGTKATLFAGPSGAGKSTTALTLAQRGYPLISDDFLVTSSDTVQGLYKRVKVHDARLNQTVRHDWPILNPNTPDQKRIVELDQSLITGPQPIGCLVVPRIGTYSKLEPLDEGEALSAIAPASLSGLLGGNSASLSRIATLTERFPCFRLTLDESALREPRVLDAVVAEIRSMGLT